MNKSRSDAGSSDLSEPSGSPEPRLAGRQLLIVEDNRDAAEVVLQVLMLQGAVAQICQDGESCLQLCTRQAFDAVLLDLGLPDLSGIEVARRLREECLGSPRIVALTGYDQEALAPDLFDLYLTKPVGAPELVDNLDRLLNAR